MEVSTNSSILQAAEDFVQEYLPKHLDEGMVYHDLSHTKDVVEAAKLIGEKTGLSDDELEIVIIAAWFHDTGYTVTYEGHEDESKIIASEFLMDKGYDTDKIEMVLGCIEVTKMCAEPTNTLEAVLKDADVFHISTSESPEKGTKLRKEWRKCLKKNFSEEQWYKDTIDFYESQKFYTEYGKTELQPKKEENLKKVRNSLMNVNPLPVNKDEGKRKKKKKKSLAKPDKGIETVFRTTSRNHINLSAIADRKANIMISVNSIIISIVVTVIIRQVDEYPHLLIPTLILLTVCMTTIVYAILAVRPQVSKGKFTDSDVMERKTNLLFFGNFHNMRIENYEWGMRELMKDSDYLYGSLIRDIYFLGKVLAKKYKLLRTAYNIFMYGLIISVLAFATAVLLSLEDILF